MLRRSETRLCTHHSRTAPQTPTGLVHSRESPLQDDARTTPYLQKPTLRRKRGDESSAIPASARCPGRFGRKSAPQATVHTFSRPARACRNCRRRGTFPRSAAEVAYRFPASDGSSPPPRVGALIFAPSKG